MTPKGRKQLATDEDVRRALAGAIGRQVRDDIWPLLVQDGYVQEVIDGFDDAFSSLKNKYLTFDTTFPQRAATFKTAEKREIPPDKRHLALAEIAAIEAGRMREVVAFREEVLAGRLISGEEVPGWVERQAGEDGEATCWVRAPLPPGVEVDFSRGHTLDWVRPLAEEAACNTTWYPVGIEVETLDYPPLPTEKQGSRAVAIRRDGVLGRLKSVAKHLTGNFTWWQEGQAVAFILTGVIPLPNRGRGSITLHNVSPSRVKLDLDPRLSSQEVAALYAKVRKHVFTGRDKPMSDKHLVLAVFLARQPEGTWKQIMKAWNEEKKECAYSEWRTFARDAKAAWERVTGRKWLQK